MCVLSRCFLALYKFGPPCVCSLQLPPTTLYSPPLLSSKYLFIILLCTIGMFSSALLSIACCISPVLFLGAHVASSLKSQYSTYQVSLSIFSYIKNLFSCLLEIIPLWLNSDQGVVSLRVFLLGIVYECLPQPYHLSGSI